MSRPPRDLVGLSDNISQIKSGSRREAPLPPVKAQIQRNQDCLWGKLRPSTVLQAHFFLQASGNETKGNARRFQSVFPHLRSRKNMERMVRCVDIGAAVDLYLKLATTEALRDVVTMENTEIRALTSSFGTGICCDHGKGIFSVAKTRNSANGLRLGGLVDRSNAGGRELHMLSEDRNILTSDQKLNHGWNMVGYYTENGHLADFGRKICSPDLGKLLGQSKCKLYLHVHRSRFTKADHIGPDLWPNYSAEISIDLGSSIWMRIGVTERKTKLLSASVPQTEVVDPRF
ncbi:hypothetical protein B0H19DRAFT_1071505 [Mycena capillaripes]|nr:hypothetical protein B0H19DRAFT_1071505 [Mycena capillaripes]